MTDASIKYFAKKPPVKGIPASDKRKIVLVAARTGCVFARPLYLQK